MRFVRVAVPLPIQSEFTYRVPQDLQDRATAGSRVEVQFGNRKLLGVIVGDEEDPGDEHKIRDLSAVLDSSPTLTTELLQLTRWVSEYYMCSWGEAIRTALPPGLNRLSATVPMMRQEAFLSFPHAFRQRERLDEIKREIRGKKQVAVVEALEELLDGSSSDAILKSDVMQLAGAGHSSVKSLVDKGVIDSHLRDATLKLAEFDSRGSKRVILSTEQEDGLQQIAASIATKQFSTVLLHGVTGSGKTEVYIRALEQVLSEGRQGIVLVPEIALTPQTVGRFRAPFGDQVSVMHSRMSVGERVAAWKKIREGRASIAIGPRSVVFAPLDKLGLIIVDEEHETSYKQHEPAPRYHARDAAVMRAKMNDAVCVLGSATPSLETYANALASKYKHVRLTKRVPLADGSNATLPTVQLIDLTLENKKKRLVGNFSPQLIAAIEERLSRKEQIILLQNRRGFAPVLECVSCGWSPYCPSCSVTLTYHRTTHTLRCHYCGFATAMPAACETCKSGKLERLGSGTQRVEDDLHKALPGARVLRMDMDSTSGRTGHFDILEAFEQGDADILLGTQMVAKGLDFGRVTLVGVINADVGLLLPDYRAEERTFQLLLQVAGRSGRADRPGEVLIQTRNPSHPLFTFLANSDYDRFARYVLSIRKQLNYPPYSRMVAVAFRGPDENVVSDFSKQWASTFSEIAPGEELLGPLPSFIGRMKRQYRFHIFLKIETSKFSHVRDLIRQTHAAVRAPGRDYHAFVDVDSIGVY